jgi:selenocysteine lyase/cysteine desulfurase
MQNIHEIRKNYPILQDKIQLSSCSQSAMHINVKRDIEEYMTSWEVNGMDWELWMEVCEQARTKFARLINAKPSEVSIVSSLSHAMSAIITSLKPEKNKNEMILSEAEFPTIGHVALSQDHVKVHFTAPKTEAYQEMISDQTFFTSIPNVYFYNGEILDVKQISKHAHEKGSYVFVDAYQAAGQIDIDVKESNVDFLASGMQKYLLGIPGIAFLYVKEEVANSLTPKITGWFGQENPFAFDAQNVTYAAGAKRFDSGTFPMINGFAANSALDVLLDVGVKNIEQYLRKLSQFTMDYANHYGLTIASPADVTKKGSNTAIRVDRAGEMEQALKAQNILVSARNDVIRIAPHYYNTEDDIKKAIDELVEMI